jgi:hypothetical protein
VETRAYVQNTVCESSFCNMTNASVVADTFVKKRWDISETKLKLLFNVKIKMPKYELQNRFPTYRRSGSMTCLFYLQLYVVN